VAPLSKIFQRHRIGIIEKGWKPADEILSVGAKISREWEQFCERPPVSRVRNSSRDKIDG